MRIVDNTDQSVSIEYLTRLIDRECSGDYDVVLFDRLYLSHMFRTHSEVADYSAIEDKLRAFDTETFFLEVDEDLVASRVAKAAEHRDLTWKEYIYTKGQTIEEVAAYYIGQQRNQLVMLRQSTLPYKVCNTSSHEYDKIAGAIVSRLNPGAPA